MGDLAVLLRALHAAALTFSDVHGFEELFLAIHALELDVGVTSRGRFIFGARIFNHEGLRFYLHIFYLLPEFQDGLSWLFCLALEDAKALV